MAKMLPLLQLLALGHPAQAEEAWPGVKTAQFVSCSTRNRLSERERLLINISKLNMRRSKWKFHRLRSPNVRREGLNLIRGPMVEMIALSITTSAFVDRDAVVGNTSLYINKLEAWSSVRWGNLTCCDILEAVMHYLVFRRIFGKSTKWFCDLRAFKGISSIHMGIWSFMDG
jgi:hypothetical protein